MKLLLLGAASGALLILAPHELVEQHEVGSVLRTTFSYESDSTVVDRRTLVGGEEGPGAPDMEQTQSRSAQGVIVDRKSSVSDGQLTGFSREYLDLSEVTEFSVSGPMVGERERTSEKVSALDGVTVNFVQEEGEFTPSFSGDEAGDEQLLAGLEATLPWAEFLPEEDVAVDDEWELEPSVLWRAMNLGGDLSLVEEGTDGPGSDGVQVFKAPTGLDDVELDGEIKASLVEVYKVDGARRAKIAFDVDFSKYTDMLENQPEQGDGGPDMQSMEVDMAYEGEGVLVWDLDGGYPVSLRLELETEETITMVMLVAMGPETKEIEQIIVSEGEYLGIITVEVESE